MGRPRPWPEMSVMLAETGCGTCARGVSKAGDQLVGMLDAHEGVRRAFDGFLTAGDVLADLSALSANLNQQQLGPSLKEHARWALLAERNVYFDDAGGESKGVPVEGVAIDLPVVLGDGGTTRVIRHVLGQGDRVLKPTMTACEKPRHFVVTGAPGNGKSTVAKFLTHAYRAAFVGEDSDLGDEHLTTVVNAKARLTAMGCQNPANRRWPVNVDLAKFAIAQATNSEYTLLHWIASHLTRQVASKDVPRWELWKWLQAWPSFIVLDGLDEVTELIRQTLDCRHRGVRWRCRVQGLRPTRRCYDTTDRLRRRNAIDHVRPYQLGRPHDR